MNLRKIWIFRIGLLLMLFIFAPPLLLADNCSAPSDCFGNLAAAAAAAAAAGVLAGGLGIDWSWSSWTSGPDVDALNHTDFSPENSASAEVAD